MDYSHLDPQQVLDALDAVGLRGDGRLLQLNSYENRVFQVFLEDPHEGHSAVVAKFYRPGRWSDAQILEEHSFALELAAAEVPVVPPLVLQVATPPVQLLGTPPTLACGFGHRYAVAARCAGRHHLNPHADGQRALKLLLAGGFVPPTELPAWLQACEQALAAVNHAFEAVQPLQTLRLHGDCHLGNVLWRDGAPHVVDLDDAMQGPAVQDLWMLVSGDYTTMAQQLNTLLEGYEQFCDFDDRERALIEPLRTLRMLRHSAWLAERWSDPTFPLNFPFFGSAAYWNQQTTQLREQLELMAG